MALPTANGHRFELHIHEHLEARRDRFSLLAPVGGSFEAPSFFPFLWLPTMSFVPRRGTEVSLRVDGQSRTISRLPLPIGGRRCLMARYDLDAMVCQLNPTWVTDPSRTAAAGTEPSPDDSRDVVEVDGRPGLAEHHVRRGAHSCAVRLDPPLPDPRLVSTPTRLEGSVQLVADGVVQLQGRYGLERTDEQVTLVIDRIGPWRTRHRRPLLGVLFRLPIFRRWPTTYRWEATLDLTAAPGTAWSSRWSRTG